MTWGLGWRYCKGWRKGTQVLPGLGAWAASILQVDAFKVQRSSEYKSQDLEDAWVEAHGVRGGGN